MTNREAVLETASIAARPTAIIFDWDNTLVDTWHAIHDAQNYTLAAFGLRQWTLEETKLKVGSSMRDSFPALFGARWREAGEIFYRRFNERHMQTLAPMPGAEDLLTALRAAGIYLGVVSNKRGDYLRKEAQHLGWTGYFARLVGAFDAPRDKPAADPVHLALEGSGIAAAADVWVVGDTVIGMECATNAACLPVLLRSVPPHPEEFDLYAPSVHVDGCMTLLKLLEKL